MIVRKRATKIHAYLHTDSTVHTLTVLAFRRLFLRIVDGCLVGSFLGETFYERLGLTMDDALGRPLASIVDPRDAYALKCAVYQVLNRAGALGEGGGSEAGPGGSLVNLRVVSGTRSYEAGMTITKGSEGLVVVTRLY